MKRKLFLVVMCILCLASISGGTLAYFTDTGTAHNVITTGSVSIAVEEWQMVDGKQEPYPQKQIAVMPGSTVSKVVCIRNREAESFIRAAVNILVADENGDVISLPPEEIQKIIHLDMNSADWQQSPGDTVWWYYRYPVSGDESTRPLFTGAAFSGKNMGNSFCNSTIEIRVLAQAVQTAHNGASAITARGWPEN